MQSYQCSPLSDAKRIQKVFQQTAKFQAARNLDEYTSVVVLDEVGLAEDSPKMPLKVLHPLLEEGIDGLENLPDEDSEDLSTDDKDAEREVENGTVNENDLDPDVSCSENKRVAFVGISNWALDPAKMNRALMLCRSSPTLHDLIHTAKYESYFLMLSCCYH